MARILTTCKEAREILAQSEPWTVKVEFRPSSLRLASGKFYTPMPEFNYTEQNKGWDFQTKWTRGQVGYLTEKQCADAGINYEAQKNAPYYVSENVLVDADPAYVYTEEDAYAEGTAYTE